LNITGPAKLQISKISQLYLSFKWCSYVVHATFTHHISY